MSTTKVRRRARPRAHPCREAGGLNDPVSPRIRVEHRCVRGFAGSEFAAAERGEEIVLVVTHGFGKLLTDDGVQQFKGPCTIAVTSPGPFAVVNVGASELGLVVIAMPATLRAWLS